MNYLDEFITYLATVKNAAPGTCRAYKSSLEKLFRGANLSTLDDITPEAVENYFAERLKDGMSVNGNFNIMVALRAFLKFCIKRKGYSGSLDLFEPPRRVRLERDYMTAEDINDLLSVTRRERDRLMMLILFTSGCRIGELAQITVESIVDNKFRVIAKGGKPRPYYFDPVVADRLQDYLRIEGITSGPIFTMSNGKPVGKAAISHALKKAAAQAGITKKATAHTYRHGFATAMFENGADARTVQETMGHKSLNTTMIYMHVTDNRIKESHERFAPKVSQPVTFNQLPSYPQNHLAEG